MPFEKLSSRFCMDDQNAFFTFSVANDGIAPRAHDDTEMKSVYFGSQFDTEFSFACCQPGNSSSEK